MVWNKLNGKHILSLISNNYDLYMGLNKRYLFLLREIIDRVRALNKHTRGGVQKAPVTLSQKFSLVYSDTGHNCTFLETEN